jgi:arginase
MWCGPLTMHVQLIAIPYDSGHRGRRLGAGPERLLRRGLVERLQDAGHVVDCRIIEASGEWQAEIRTMFELATAAASAVADACRAGRFPLLLSGNCGPSAIAAVGGSPDPLAVFWFDAHGDFNTPETTIGGYLDGMSLATLTGRCWRELAAQVPGFHPVPTEAVTLMGTRDLDPLEADALRSSDVRMLSSAEVRELAPLESRAAALAGDYTGTYVHLDLDVIDPTVAKANIFAAPGGLTPAEVTGAIEVIGASSRLGAAAVTAYDPDMDTSNAVADLASELAVSLVHAAEGGLSR